MAGQDLPFCRTAQQGWITAQCNGVAQGLLHSPWVSVPDTPCVCKSHLGGFAP